MRFTRVLLLVSLLALVVAPVALALRFTDDSYNMPLGATGQPYSKTFDGAGGCGPALPYQYRVLAGALPAGLSLSKSGTISGTPTQGGSYEFWVELSDENPPSASWCAPTTAQRLFTITILQGLNIVQNALNPKVATTGAPYSFQLSAEGGGSQSWSLISGALPAGMALSSTGVIAGTPTATGDFTFKVQVADGNRKDSETYTLTVVDPLKISKTPGAAEVGLPFEFTPTATGGRPGYVWAATEGTLPAGLTLDPATGAIAGKPAVAGSYPLKLTVTDQLGLTATLDVPLVVAAKLAITKKPLPAAKVGKAYKAKFLTKGGVLALQWNFLGGRPGFLPTGLKLNRKTGQLSGTPRKAGTYYLRMQVVDKLGAKAAISYVLKVSA
jgi:large repetitive protein